MSEIDAFAQGVEPTATWERVSWDKGVALWEDLEEKKAVQAVADAKAAKKAAREAANAAAAAAKEAEAAAAA